MWYSAERGWNNFANQLSVQLPQTVLCRCSKPDFSWFSPSKELTIETPFPSLYKASSNSPVALGSDLRLAATDLSESGMSYLWTPPSGVTLPSGTVLTQRTLTLANAQENYGGTYQLAVGYGGCQLTTSTTVTISACENLYIKSYNASTGTETTQLKAKAGVLPRSYERLTLQAQTLDGKLLPNATYTWVAPTGVSLGQDASRPYAVTTDRVGNYKVTVGFAGSSQTCPLAIDIAATPCQLYTDGNCSGTSNIKDTGTGNVNIANLAIGDIFQAGDYEVTVTKLTTGSQASGYTGEGLVQQNLISGIKIPLTVTFENIKINECYQYYNHTPTDASIYVKTKFDESWSSVVDAGILTKYLISGLSEIYNTVYDNIATIDCSTQSISKFTDATKSLKEIKDNFGTLFNVPPSVVSAYQTKIEEISSSVTCKVQQSCPSSSTRVSLVDCDFDNNKTKFKDLICELLTIETKLDNPSIVGSPIGNTDELVAYYSPAGEIVLLPKTTIPYFGTTTDLPVHSSALVGFKLTDGRVFFAKYSKIESVWQFIGYYNANSTTPYRFPATPSSILDLNGKTNLAFVLGAGVVIGKGYTLEEILIATGTSLPKNPPPPILPYWLRGSIICALGELLMTDDNTHCGIGPLAEMLPTKGSPAPVGNIPSGLIITLPHKEPQESGNCHVYVIWGPNFEDITSSKYGKPDISKYGMTCKSDCENRPDSQVIKFNNEDKALILANNSINYSWTWLFRNKSKEVCHLIEKSMTAAYVMNSGGKLPPKHGLPCLVRDKDWDEGKGGPVENERKRRAIEWINEQIIKYGK